MCILLSSNNKFINHSNHFGGIVSSLNGAVRKVLYKNIGLRSTEFLLKLVQYVNLRKLPSSSHTLTKFPIRMVFWSTSQRAFLGHYMVLTWYCSHIISRIVLHTFNWKRPCVGKFLTKIGIMCNGIICYPWPNISENGKENML